MTKDDVIHIATEYVERRWGRRAQLIGARPPSSDHREWSVQFKTVIPGESDDVVVDGPTVVLVDSRTRGARFLMSL